MFKIFSKDYFSSDDIDYEKLKKMAFSNDKKTNNKRNENNKKYGLNLLFGLSFPKISGV